VLLYDLPAVVASKCQHFIHALGRQSDDVDQEFTVSSSMWGSYDGEGIIGRQSSCKFNNLTKFPHDSEGDLNPLGRDERARESIDLLVEFVAQSFPLWCQIIFTDDFPSSSLLPTSQQMGQILFRVYQKFIHLCKSRINKEKCRDITLAKFPSSHRIKSKPISGQLNFIAVDTSEDSQWLDGIVTFGSVRPHADSENISAVVLGKRKLVPGSTFSYLTSASSEFDLEISSKSLATPRDLKSRLSEKDFTKVIFKVIDKEAYQDNNPSSERTKRDMNQLDCLMHDYFQSHSSIDNDIAQIIYQGYETMIGRISTKAKADILKFTPSASCSSLVSESNVGMQWLENLMEEMIFYSNASHQSFPESELILTGDSVNQNRKTGKSQQVMDAESTYTDKLGSMELLDRSKGNGIITYEIMRIELKTQSKKCKDIILILMLVLVSTAHISSNSAYASILDDIRSKYLPYSIYHLVYMSYLQWMDEIRPCIVPSLLGGLDIDDIVPYNHFTTLSSYLNMNSSVSPHLSLLANYAYSDFAAKFFDSIYPLSALMTDAISSITNSVWVSVMPSSSSALFYFLLRSRQYANLRQYLSLLDWDANNFITRTKTAETANLRSFHEILRKSCNAMVSCQIKSIECRSHLIGSLNKLYEIEIQECSEDFSLKDKESCICSIRTDIEDAALEVRSARRLSNHFTRFTNIPFSYSC
jgi:hypothetical protein